MKNMPAGAPAKWHKFVDKVAEFSYHQSMAHSAVVSANSRSSGVRAQGLRIVSLGLKAASAGDLIQQIQQGFAFAALQTLAAESGIALSQLAAVLGIPERTLARRKAERKLTWEESERLLRVARVFESAVELFEDDVPAAVRWLTTPRKALSGQAPLTYSRTEVGAREVAGLIGRLEHGIFS